MRVPAVILVLVALLLTGCNVTWTSWDAGPTNTPTLAPTRTPHDVSGLVATDFPGTPLQSSKDTPVTSTLMPGTHPQEVFKIFVRDDSDHRYFNVDLTATGDVRVQATVPIATGPDQRVTVCSVMAGGRCTNTVNNVAGWVYIIVLTPTSPRQATPPEQAIRYTLRVYTGDDDAIPPTEAPTTPLALSSPASAAQLASAAPRACSGTANTSGVVASYKPPLLPIRFTIGADGHISVSLDLSIISFLGEISLDATKQLTDVPQTTLVIFRNGTMATVYRVCSGQNVLKATTDGPAQILVEGGRITIDVTNASGSTVELVPTENH